MRTLPCVVFILLASATFAQIERNSGWLEGTVVNESGDAAWDWPNTKGAKLTLRPRRGKSYVAYAEVDKGGYYTFRNLNPGAYELFVSRSYAKVAGDWAEFKPQHIFSVLVPRGKRTILNVVVHPGKRLEEVGKPTMNLRQPRKQHRRRSK